jgi:hypothetical protein
MQNITIEKALVNTEALDAALRTALGAAVSGISYTRSVVTVHLADDATPEQVNQASTIVLTHDPAQLTAEQQAELDRRSRLAQARQDWGAAELDLAGYGGQAAPIQQLAQKIVLLEREIGELRKGQG